jgi:TatD DNase family protein
MTDAVIEWFDSHCHLQAEFTEKGGDQEGPHATHLTGTLARAAEAGVTRMVCVGTGADTSAEAVALARHLRHPDSVAAAEGVEVWATVGLHPHDADAGTDAIEALLNHELREGAGAGRPDRAQPLVAVGECGLDYHYDHSPRPRQREAFARQVELAHRHALPLVVHSREAWEDTIAILAGAGVPERTVLHCFTGGPDEARRCLDLGAYLSFSGVVTFKNAAEVRAAAELCPLDRLLVETDAPFLAPVPHRGTVNEPSRVPLVGAAVAQVKGVETAVVAGASTANARAVFGI